MKAKPFFAAAYAAVLLGLVGLSVYGWDYYTAPAAKRVRHALHPLLRQSGTLGHLLGIIGALFMILLLAYSLRKRLRFMRGWGNLDAWLNVHIFFGLAGPALVLFHAVFKIGGLVGLCFGAMVVVVASGVVGRYIYRMIPRSLSGMELSRIELEAEEIRLTFEIRKFLPPAHRFWDLMAGTDREGLGALPPRRVRGPPEQSPQSGEERRSQGPEAAPQADPGSPGLAAEETAPRKNPEVAPFLASLPHSLRRPDVPSPRRPRLCHGLYGALMDLLTDHRVLLFLIGAFLFLVVFLPFVRWEIRKLRRARLLVHQIVPLSGLSEADISRIESRHPTGRKMYPSINRGVCVGCGTCVLTCKKNKTLVIISGKSTLLDPRLCDGCGECEKACPTGANQLIEYGQKLKVRAPQIDENFETNVPGIYIIGTLAGAGLIKESINQGRAVLNVIMRGVFPARLPHLVIVGAGPAGLSAFLSSRKFGLPATCLEKDAAANTIKNFPKRKIVMAEPLDMPLVGPIWVGDTTREKLLEVWDRILEKTAVPIITGARLEAVRKKGSVSSFRPAGGKFPAIRSSWPWERGASPAS